MPELNIDRTTTPLIVTDDKGEPLQTEGVNEAGETWITYPEFTKWFAYYRSKEKSYSKVRMALNAYASWVLGQGWTADKLKTLQLKNIRGWGEDTLLSILWNMLVVKKFNGDSFAESIRNPEDARLLNLKPLDPSTMTTFLNPQGIIIRYEQTAKTGNTDTRPRTLKPHQVLHLVNDRVADHFRGVSVIEAVEWNLQAQEEAKRAHRKMVKRNGIVRVIEVDTEDTTKIANFKIQWKAAIDAGDVLILPKDVAEAKDWHGQLDTAGVVQWLNYLDDEFFMIIGIPKIIMGGSGEIEGDAKVSYLAFEQVYKREVNELIDDLWNQLALKIKFNSPASLKSTLADNEEKNTSQLGFQPNDTTAGVGA